MEIVKRIEAFFKPTGPNSGAIPWPQFAETLAKRESSCDYGVVNQFGYLGKYQFGLARLTDFGLCARRVGTKGWHNAAFEWREPFSKELFLTSQALQEEIFNRHLNDHKKWLLKKYKWLLDKELHGTRVTLSGALAVLHLVGRGGWQQWVSGKTVQDGNGTKATEYLQLFANYQIPEFGTVDLASLIGKIKAQDRKG